MNKEEVVFRYNHMLDEKYGTFEIGYLKFRASTILRQMAKMTYRAEFLAWLSEEDLDTNDFKDFIRSI